MAKYNYLILCEHASSTMPAWLQSYMKPIAQRILRSHGGWDFGAPEIGGHLAQRLKTQMISGQHSRLLIDLNRNKNSPNVWSPWTTTLPEKVKNKIFEKYYDPFRQQGRRALVQKMKTNKTLVFAVHSFIPVWKKKKRKTDIGLLFNHFDLTERKLAESLRGQLQERLPGWKIHFNLPYRGFTDCYLNDLLNEFRSSKKMTGIFLEFNQARLKTSKQRKFLKEIVAQSIIGMGELQ